MMMYKAVCAANKKRPFVRGIHQELVDSPHKRKFEGGIAKI